MISGMLLRVGLLGRLAAIEILAFSGRVISALCSIVRGRYSVSSNNICICVHFLSIGLLPLVELCMLRA